mgnify:CR=1
MRPEEMHDGLAELLSQGWIIDLFGQDDVPGFCTKRSLSKRNKVSQVAANSGGAWFGLVRSWWLVFVMRLPRCFLTRLEYREKSNDSFLPLNCV